AGPPRSRRDPAVRRRDLRFPESRCSHGPLPSLAALRDGGRHHDRVGGRGSARGGAGELGGAFRKVDPAPRALDAPQRARGPSPEPPPPAPPVGRSMDGPDPGHLLEEIRRRLRDGNRDELAVLLVGTHPSDLAGALRELDLAEQVTVLRQLPREEAGTVLYEMDDGSRLTLMDAL